LLFERAAGRACRTACLRRDAADGGRRCGQVRRDVDFRNVEILHVFMSPAGRLPARRKSRLKQSVHRHMCRQIKVRAAARRVRQPFGAARAAPAPAARSRVGRACWAPC